MIKISKDKRNKLLIVGFATVLPLAALWYVLLTPQCRKLVEIAKKTTEAETKLADGVRTTATAQTAEADLEKVSARLKAIESSMPSGDMYAWFIQTIERFRLPYRVDLPQKSREVMGEAGSLPKFPYRAATFTVQGGAYFHDFGKFLSDFENTFPYMRVQNLELEANPGSATNSEDREKLSFKMEIVS